MPKSRLTRLKLRPHVQLPLGQQFDFGLAKRAMFSLALPAEAEHLVSGNLTCPANKTGIGLKLVELVEEDYAYVLKHLFRLIDPRKKCENEPK